MGGGDRDVLIVGGGPAGSVAAGLLAARGHRVLLFDRDAFPRAKACGESLNPGAIRELNRLGLLAAVQRLPHRRLTCWRIRARNGTAFEGRFDPGEFGLALGRAPFDALLLDRARESGAEVRTGVRIDDLVREHGMVAGVRTATGDEFRARLVIGTDGLRSVVVRRLGLLLRRPRLRKVALTAHVAGADLPEGTGVLGLYSWGVAGVVGTSRSIANVALVLDDRSAGMIDGDPGGTFDRLVTEVSHVCESRRISPVLTTGPFDWPTRRVTTDGALLAGDAAGYFDPFTGQGIFRALRGARNAAEIAASCIAGGRSAARDLEPYELRHRSEFSAGTRLQRLIEFGATRPALFAAAVALFRAFPALADRLVAVTGDLRPVRSLILPDPGATD